MKIWSILCFIGALFCAARAGYLFSQEEGQAPPAVTIPQGEPQWITVWHLPTEANRDGTPFTDIRVVVFAKNEATAIVRSLKFFRAIFPDWVQEKLEFVEAAVRRPEGEKK